MKGHALSPFSSNPPPPKPPAICIAVKGLFKLLINTELACAAPPNPTKCPKRNCFIKSEKPLKISCLSFYPPPALFSFLIQIQRPWFMQVSPKKRGDAGFSAKNAKKTEEGQATISESAWQLKLLRKYMLKTLVWDSELCLERRCFRCLEHQQVKFIIGAGFSLRAHVLTSVINSGRL